MHLSLPKSIPAVHTIDSSLNLVRSVITILLILAESGLQLVFAQGGVVEIRHASQVGDSRGWFHMGWRENFRQPCGREVVKRTAPGVTRLDPRPDPFDHAIPFSGLGAVDRIVSNHSVMRLRLVKITCSGQVAFKSWSRKRDGFH